MATEAIVLVEGEYGIPTEFQWQGEYDALIEQIADTNVVDSEWDVLQTIFKYKLSENVLHYIKDSESQPAPPQPQPPAPNSDPLFVPLTESDTPETINTEGPLPPDAPPPPSPSPPYLVSPLVALDLQPSTPMGLVIAPFQPRPNGAGIHGNGAVWDTGSGRALPARLTKEEAKEELGRIFGYLHDFEGAPPFTVQRLAELAVNPRGHYKSAGKYIRALERTLLVTSTHKDYPLDTYALDVQNGAQPAIGGTPSVSSRASTPAPLDVARSPLFTPIPFLHRPAPNSHRSLSRSPPLTTSPRGPVPSGDASLTGAATSEESIPALGLVDELDDPRPGHLSDHPTALTSVTQLPPVVADTSLGGRFVSSGTVQAEQPTQEGIGSGAPEPAPVINADAARMQPSSEDYIRAGTPEPSPTRVLAEETRERELAAVVAERSAEENDDSGTSKAESTESPPVEGNAAATGTEVVEKKEDSDRMAVDEPDENKENVPS
ncbi:hypothetical protein FRC12_015189 [Ceratobasidium sp. 428]|nr:hypothetical protein FRC12_015189 [Ceratobasidium sp. 428]